MHSQIFCCARANAGRSRPALPGLDMVSIARGYGYDTARAEDIGGTKKAATQARGKPIPLLLEISMAAQGPPPLQAFLRENALRCMSHRSALQGHDAMSDRSSLRPKQRPLACSRFQRHRVRCFDGTGVCHGATEVYP